MREIFECEEIFENREKKSSDRKEEKMTMEKEEEKEEKIEEKHVTLSWNAIGC